MNTWMIAGLFIAIYLMLMLILSPTEPTFRGSFRIMAEALSSASKTFAHLVWIEKQKLNIIQHSYGKSIKYDEDLEDRATSAYINRANLKEDS